MNFWGARSGALFYGCLMGSPQERPYSEACARNREPIIQILKQVLTRPGRVLEIGSGTGQHAAYFSNALPDLQWQTSDLPENHATIEAWLTAEARPGWARPIALDVMRWPWLPVVGGPYDALFSANTCHIMSWEMVTAMFRGAASVLADGGLLLIYGPFNTGGRYTSDSNRDFDRWLRDRDAQRGIRDIEALDQLAREQGLTPLADHAMPANNRILVWRRGGALITPSASGE